MVEKHGRGGLMVAVRIEEGEEAALGEEAGLGQAGNSFEDVEKTIRVASGVGVEVGGDTEVGEDGGGNVVQLDPHEFRGGEDST